MMKKDLCEISVTRIDSRKFLKVGGQKLRLKILKSIVLVMEIQNLQW